MSLAALVFGAALATEPLPTTDGASLALQHHPAAGSPILLVHGLSSNHHSFALHGRGLAFELQAAGYDVWMLDLRGRLDSQPPPGRPTWTLDDYGRVDAAAAIQHIQSQTGHERIAYLGHSMGGMVLSVYHHWHGADALGPAVVLGSPIDFHHPDPLLQTSARSMPVARLMGRVPSPTAGHLAALFPRTRRVDELLFDAAGTSKDTRRQIYRGVVSPMYAAELGHLRDMVDAGRLVSADGTVDYVASLRDWSTPLLVVAGRADRIAPPDRVVAWLDATSSQTTTFWVAGTKRQYASEYGHLDLILADRANTELHRDIIEWLEQQDW